MKIEKAKEILHSRNENPTFPLEKIYPQCLSFEELRWNHFLELAAVAAPFSTSESPKKDIANELQDILQMFETPLLSNGQEQQFDDSEEENDGNILQQFEEKTCTIVQMPGSVSKMRFPKVEIYRSPSTKKAASNSPAHHCIKTKRILRSISPLLSEKQRVTAASFEDGDEDVKALIDDIFAPIEEASSNNQAQTCFKWFTIDNSAILLERAGFTITKELKHSQKLQLSPKSYLALGGQEYFVQEKIGEGSFGVVYSAVGEDEESLAIKLSDLSSGKWEYFILQRLKTCLSSTTRLVPHVQAFVYDGQKAALVMNRSQFSLLDAINASSGFDEILVGFYFSRMLKVCSQLWSNNFIHCDIKAEHFMLKFPKSRVNGWTGAFDKHGSNGWEEVGLELIDFGQALDISLIFDLKQLYPCSSAAHKGRKLNLLDDYTRFPWTNQVDFVGIASVLSMIIWKQDFELDTFHSETWNSKKWLDKVKGMIYRRGWRKDFWIRAFELLLTPLDECSLETQLSSMNGKANEILQELESWLEDESEKNGKSLVFMLKRLQVSLIEK